MVVRSLGVFNADETALDEAEDDREGFFDFENARRDFTRRTY